MIISTSNDLVNLDSTIGGIFKADTQITEVEKRKMIEDLVKVKAEIEAMLFGLPQDD